jgi:2-methylcitrate dehydratase PrpD
MSAPATQRVAEFVVGLRLTQVPAAAVAAEKGGILDSVGVALAGSREEPGRIAAELARDEGAREESGLFGHHVRSSAAVAAFANGTASHAMDYDASFVMMGQPMAGLAATIFALGEPLGASGRQLLEAYLAGYEVTAKIAWSMPPGAGEAGFHATATIGSLGCAAAAAKLLGLDPRQVGCALGIASSLASGSVGNFGTMTKPLHAGIAARNGVTAARLAQKGFTASEQALDENGAFYAAFAPDGEPELAAFDALGRTWDVDGGIRYKFYPCGGLAHTAIDAALALRDGLRPDDIARVDVAANPYTARRIIYGIPETELQAKFSMPYLVARALVDGRVTPESFTDEAIRQPDVIDLAHKVEMRADPSLESDTSGRRPAVLAVQLRDGSRLERRVDSPKGSAESPLTQAELEDKFIACAGRVLDSQRVDRALTMFNRLEALGEVRELSALLVG